MLAFSRYGNLPAREPAFSTERAITQASDGSSRPVPLARSLALEESKVSVLRSNYMLRGLLKRDTGGAAVAVAIAKELAVNTDAEGTGAQE
jgi:hypothetical protein